MLSIVLITPPIVAFAISPCLIAIKEVFLKFGALKERSYYEIIRLQISKIIRDEMSTGRELRRYDESVHMFQCLERTLAEIKLLCSRPGSL
ncbi:hypothetical protein BJ875DRAFT_115507 [Amylocarpus encephaloides]|uniref:Uncharacterized protein n=1 Tax=Amylocarpus encephaloides TaxID=45428 RepID=A0A9P7YEB5_9HELO|nr:hypothetical protein BJ875DRAFT_115507 [Amylocarpus encephaloides]